MARKSEERIRKRENTKLTFTPLFIEAIIRCIKKYPLINSSLDGDKIIVKKDINIGMATALPSGNLIVPVIRNADQLNLTGLARQVNSLADNARQGRLRPEDSRGRHLHPDQRRHLRQPHGNPDHQPASGGHPRRRRH
ncbi:2-oxo acid dehydrogenase subunit E2 [Puia sp. P3]|uniref:2-oxo acid dehydrogenase subunit E2 n=1 Tax=Puia sp. P3 TaxID=3423952 RepID=UPI003D675963